MYDQAPPRFTGEQYLRDGIRRFGTSNPERVDNPIWEWMARTHANPYCVRNVWGLGDHESEQPGWCVLRHGMPEVLMPDGRRISIAGEHEDSYDSEFCIYNDIVVRTGDDIEIYAYPREVFPPTDFHTATLIGDTIWILGSLGYTEDRAHDEVQVMRLDTRSYAIERVRAGGFKVPQLYRHRVRLLVDGVTIEVRGGTRAVDPDTTEPNTSLYRFDTSCAEWAEAGDSSSWRRFVLTSDAEDYGFYADKDAWVSGAILKVLPYHMFLGVCPLHDEFYGALVSHTLVVNDVPVCVIPDGMELIVNIEGPLAQSCIDELLEHLQGLARETGYPFRSVVERPIEPGYNGM